MRKRTTTTIFALFLAFACLVPGYAFALTGGPGGFLVGVQAADDAEDPNGDSPDNPSEPTDGEGDGEEGDGEASDDGPQVDGSITYPINLDEIEGLVWVVSQVGFSASADDGVSPETDQNGTADGETGGGAADLSGKVETLDDISFLYQGGQPIFVDSAFEPANVFGGLYRVDEGGSYQLIVPKEFVAEGEISFEYSPVMEVGYDPIAKPGLQSAFVTVKGTGGKVTGSRSFGIRISPAPLCQAEGPMEPGYSPDPDAAAPLASALLVNASVNGGEMGQVGEAGVLPSTSYTGMPAEIALDLKYQFDDQNPENATEGAVPKRTNSLAEGEEADYVVQYQKKLPGGSYAPVLPSEVKDAGDYRVLVEGRGNYCEVAYLYLSIDPAAPELEIVLDNPVLTAASDDAPAPGDGPGANSVGSIKVEYNGMGAVSASVSDETIVSIGSYDADSKSFTVTGRNIGEATITVSVAADGNYTAAERTVAIKVVDDELRRLYVAIEEAEALSASLLISENPKELPPGASYVEAGTEAAQAVTNLRGEIDRAKELRDNPQGDIEQGIESLQSYMQDVIQETEGKVKKVGEPVAEREGLEQAIDAARSEFDSLHPSEDGEIDENTHKSFFGLEKWVTPGAYDMLGTALEQAEAVYGSAAASALALENAANELRGVFDSVVKNYGTVGAITVPAGVDGLEYTGESQTGISVVNGGYIEEKTQDGGKVIVKGAVVKDGVEGDGPNYIALYELTDFEAVEARTYTANAHLLQENTFWAVEDRSTEDLKITWSIARAPITAAVIEFKDNAGGNYLVGDLPGLPEIESVTVADRELEVGKDYEIDEEHSTVGADPGTYEIVIEGVGNYCGQQSRTYTVNALGQAEEDEVQRVLALIEALDSDTVSNDMLKQEVGIVQKAFESLSPAQQRLVEDDAVLSAKYKRAIASLQGYERELNMKDNSLTVKAKTVKVKASKVKRKKQTVKASKAFKVSGAQGAVTYKVVKYAKKAKKKITVTKAGKVQVKKGVKRGTYKLKVAVTAAGNDQYRPATRYVTLKVKVK